MLGVDGFMTKNVPYVGTSNIDTNWDIKMDEGGTKRKYKEALQEFISLVQNICISINTSTRMSTSPIKLKYSNSIEYNRIYLILFCRGNSKSNNTI